MSAKDIVTSLRQLASEPSNRQYIVKDQGCALLYIIIIIFILPTNLWRLSFVYQYLTRTKLTILFFFFWRTF